MAYKSDCLVEEGSESESLLFNFEGPKTFSKLRKKFDELHERKRVNVQCTLKTEYRKQKKFCK